LQRRESLSGWRMGLYIADFASLISRGPYFTDVHGAMVDSSAKSRAGGTGLSARCGRLGQGDDVFVQ
jgi:hypothetical protein